VARPATRAFLTYNVARLGLLAVCLGLGALAGLRGLLLVAAALVVSGILSWFLLARQRIALGAAVEQAVARGRAKVTERTAAEDAYVDRMLTDRDITRPER
jgi:Protein of unknown function (DUF4229)